MSSYDPSKRHKHGACATQLSNLEGGNFENVTETIAPALQLKTPLQLSFTSRRSSSSSATRASERTFLSDLSTKNTSINGDNIEASRISVNRSERSCSTDVCESDESRPLKRRRFDPDIQSRASSLGDPGRKKTKKDQSHGLSCVSKGQTAAGIPSESDLREIAIHATTVLKNLLARFEVEHDDRITFTLPKITTHTERVQASSSNIVGSPRQMDSRKTSSFQMDSVKVPTYRHYRPIASNVLARNNRSLLTYPSLDTTSAALSRDAEKKQLHFEQQLCKELRYDHINPETQKLLVPRRLQYQQAGVVILPYLEQCGLNLTTVLAWLVRAGNHESESFKQLDDFWKRHMKCIPTALKETSDLLNAVGPPLKGLSDDEIATVYDVFESVAGCSLWCFIPDLLSGYHSRVDANPTGANLVNAVECAVCHMTDCNHHGQFWEALDASSKCTSLNFDDYINAKKRVATGDSQPYFESRKGGRNRRIVSPRSALQRVSATETCSKYCYLRAEARAGKTVETSPSSDQVEQISAIIAMISGPDIVPCEVSSFVDLTCAQVFDIIIKDVASGKLPHQLEMPNDRTESLIGTRLARSEFLKMKVGDRRPVFHPCAHPGVDCFEAKCTCYLKNTPCEKACACSRDCRRRFPGCSCSVGPKKKPCSTGDCFCIQCERECDADICGGCQAAAVFDAQTDNTTLPPGCCQNVAIQLGKVKKTYAGSSLVKGFGLFAGEPISKGAFICEYKGESIIFSEADRRAEISAALGMQYFFQSNAKPTGSTDEPTQHAKGKTKTQAPGVESGQDIDGTNAANKSRFANNSRKPNIKARILLCNMVNRIGFFAARPIQAGEELFLYYGYGSQQERKLLTPRLDKAGSTETGKKPSASKMPVQRAVKTGKKPSASKMPVQRAVKTGAKRK